MKLSWGVAIMGVIGLFLSLIGCGPKLRGGQISGTDTSTPGVRYFAGKDVVVIKGKVTRSAVRAVANSQLKLHGFELFSTGELELKTIADRSRTYVLEMIPGGTADNTLDLTLAPTGLPKAINLTSTDRSGEVVASSIKFAARVAALVATGGIGVAASAQEAVTVLEGTDVLEALYDRWKESEASYVELQVRAEKLERQQLLAIDADPEKQAKLRAAAKAEYEAVLGVLNIVKARREELWKALQAEYAAYKARAGVGPLKDERDYQYTLAIGELPKDADLGSLAGKSPAQVEAALAANPVALSMWKEIGVAVTVKDLLPTDQPPGQAFAASDELSGQTRVYYRISRPMQFSVYVRDHLLEDGKDGKEATVRLQSRAVLDVLSEADEPVSVAFKEKPFSKQGVAIGFNDRGQLLTLKREGTSSIAGAASALAAGAEAAPTEFLGGLTSAQAIAAKRREIGAAELQAEKARIDAETERIKSEIARLQAQKQLDDLLKPKPDPAPQPDAPGSNP